MNGLLMIVLQSTSYMPAAVVSRMDAINGERERLGAQYDNNEAVANEMITAYNATAETFERKSKARFVRLELINNLMQQIDLALSWSNDARREAGKEYSRYIQEIPEAKAKVRADLLSIGFDAEFARRNDSLHPQVLGMTRRMDEARVFEVSTIPSWQRSLREEKVEWEKLQQQAVKKIS